MYLTAQMVKNLPAMEKIRIQSLSWKDPLQKGMDTTLVFLPGEFHRQRSLASYRSMGVTKGQTQLNN